MPEFVRSHNLTLPKLFDWYANQKELVGSMHYYANKLKVKQTRVDLTSELAFNSLFVYLLLHPTNFESDEAAEERNGDGFFYQIQKALDFYSGNNRFSLANWAACLDCTAVDLVEHSKCLDTDFHMTHAKS
jgi:hypothetical protein